jgi:hypothetical protein
LKFIAMLRGTGETLVLFDQHRDIGGAVERVAAAAALAGVLAPIRYDVGIKGALKRGLNPGLTGQWT